MRGAFVGSISAAVSVAAHAVGGGTSADGSMALLLSGCAAFGAVIASTRIVRYELSFLLLSLTAGQAIGHITLTLGDTHHHGLKVGPTMLAAHAVAAAVSAVLIRASGRGCAIALSALRRIIPAPFRAVPVAVPVASITRHYSPSVARCLLVGSRLGTRGPPQSE